MTSKKGSRNNRYNKATASTDKGTTATVKSTVSNSKKTTPSSKKTTLDSKVSSPANEAQKPTSKAPILTKHDIMSSSDFAHMRRRYYIVRPEPNKTCVPMIAVDELPAGFRLQGVPLTVTPQQINEWDMARVGADVVLKASFEVEACPASRSQQIEQPRSPENISSSQGKSEPSTKAISGSENVDEEGSVKNSNKPDSSAKSEQSSHSETKKMKSRSEGLASVLRIQQEANEAAHGVVEQNKWEKDNDRSKTQDAATPGVYGKKKYCTHWIRTGNCDYMQEGCRYLHVIPDAETRLTIGIRDMPRWAKEDLPSPPRDINPLRRRSWSPPKEKRDSHKDWRNRVSRKAHAELPAGPPLMSRVASERPSTPTPQPTFHAKPHGLQHGKMGSEMSGHAIAPAEGNFTAHSLSNNNHDGHPNVQEAQHKAFPPGSSIAAPRPISTPTAPIEPGSLRAAQMGPHLEASYPHPIPYTHSTPPAASNMYGQFSHPFHETRDQSPRAFNNSGFRHDNHRWGYPAQQHPYSLQHASPPGSPFGNIWRRGPLASPAPSFSDMSVGTIGHGRPGTASPIIGTPIMHKRLFRQPDEPQYVQAKPQRSGNSMDGRNNRGHLGKGNTPFEAHGREGSHSGEVGNLISLDEEGNFGGN